MVTEVLACRLEERRLGFEDPITELEPVDPARCLWLIDEEGE